MILFDFMLLDIESHAGQEIYTSRCNFDYPVIHDGDNESNSLLGKYCAPMSHGNLFEVNYTDTCLRSISIRVFSQIHNIDNNIKIT